MFTGTIIIILGLAFISGMTTLIGVALAFFTKSNHKLIVLGIGFSTGIMLLISIIELIPQSISQLDIWLGLIAVLMGAIFSWLANRIIPHSHLVKESHQAKGRLIIAAYMIVFGLILHDVPEGFAMANAFAYAPSFGIIMAIAIALHNIPEEFAMAAPLIAAQRSKKTIYGFAFISGLAEPAGAIMGIFAVSVFDGIIPWLMGFTAGIMIFISLHELYPMARKYQRPSWLVFGIILSIIIYVSLISLINV